MSNQRLTCYKINEEVAERLGWESTSNRTPLGDRLWLPPYPKDNYQGLRLLPDFCGEWQNAGPLLEEIIFSGFPWTLRAKDIRLTEVITRAWHMWKKGDEDD